MTEVKCKEAPREEYLKGPILTRRVYAEENVDSLSKSSKMEIHHLQARFPGIYAPALSPLRRRRHCRPCPHD